MLLLVNSELVVLFAADHNIEEFLSHSNIAKELLFKLALK